MIDRLDPTHGVEEIRIRDEEEYFPPPRSLRELIGAIDAVATFCLGGSVPDRPPLNDRTVRASDVLASLS